MDSKIKSTGFSLLCFRESVKKINSLRIELHLLLLAVFVFLCLFSRAQTPRDSTLVINDGLIKPNLISVHHFGLFLGRMEQDFKVKSNPKTTLNFQLKSGNIFHPYVESYLPADPAIRAGFADETWFFRQFDYVDQQTTPAEIQNIVIDAVYKTLRADIVIPFNDYHELRLGLRAFATIKGSPLDSPLTGDDFIEWFHSNVAGGEDAFGRRFYGLNEVNINFRDRNGRTLSMDHGDVILGGIETAYTYHLPWKKANDRGWFLNTTSQLSINTHRYNRGLDMGTGMSVLKKINHHDRSKFWIGLGSSVLATRLIDRSENIEIINNRFLNNNELSVQWVHTTVKGNENRIMLHYQNQSPYFDRDEQDYFHLKGAWDAINQGWHHGYTTLIENTSFYTLVYSHIRKSWALQAYLKQDLAVNMAPDLETGVSLTVPL
jgi:hypothetical protein